MNAKSELALVHPPNGTALTPLEMLQTAVDRGLDAETLGKLMELQREWKSDQAREAFTVAMNAFRAEAIGITKTKSVYHGDKFMYRHATLANIVELVVPRLSVHGLSHRWETKQEGTSVTVTCLLTHERGHSIQTSLTAPPDASGGKNGIQGIGSTVSYLQRYTFLAITGLAARDSDDDGDGGDKPVTITDEQIADLESLMTEVGVIGQRRDAALKAWRVEKLSQILAANYSACVKQVEAKRK